MVTHDWGLDYTTQYVLNDALPSTMWVHILFATSLRNTQELAVRVAVHANWP